MPKTRLGLVGCGGISGSHISAMQALSDRCELVRVADVNEEAARRRAQEVGCPYETDYRRVFPHVEAVVLCTPHHLHAPMVLDAAEAGLHILCEKPMATTLEDADRMIEVCERRGVKLMIGYPARYLPAFRMLHDLVVEGRYGRPFLIQSQMEADVSSFLQDWMRRKDALGGGALFSAAGHLLDTMIWMMGDVVRAFCVKNSLLAGMEGEDTAVAGFEFANGVIGGIVETWVAKYARHTAQIAVYCEDGVLEVSVGSWPPPVSGRLVLRRDTEEVFYETPDKGWDFTGEMAHFLDCVQHGLEPLTNGREARRSMAALLAAYRAYEALGR